MASPPVVGEHKIPVVGFGTYSANVAEMEAGMEHALEAGYRFIDTAYFYKNEDIIGRVLQKWFTSGKLKREDVFVSTKLPSFGNRPEGVKKYIEKSLKSLQLDYVDLYLIHSPFGLEDVVDEEKDSFYQRPIDFSTDIIAIWKAMEEQVKAGKAKAIGLSNFSIPQIQRILDVAEIVPANLQIELHVYNQQEFLVAFCKKNKITVTAYSPLGAASSGRVAKDAKTGEPLPQVLQNPVVNGIAEKVNKSVAQVLLRHLVQKGLIVIPKSANPERMKNNFDIFSFQLSSDDMKALNLLDQGESGRLMDIKAIFKGIEQHPEFPY